MEICKEDLKLIYHILDGVSPDLAKTEFGRFEIDMNEHEYIDKISLSDEEYIHLKNIKYDISQQLINDVFD